MTGRKKGPSAPAPDGARAFTVVLEQLRGEFKVFGEALDGVRQQMNDRFETVDRRFDAVDRRFERVEHDLGEVKRELGEVKRDLGEVKGELGEVKRDLGEVKRDLGEVKRDLGVVKTDLGEVQSDLADVKVDLGLVKSAATTHSRELREIRGALGNKVERGEVEAIVEHVVARIAAR